MVFKKGNKLWKNPNSRKTQFKKGNESWNKGKTKENSPILKKISLKMKGNRLWDNTNSKKNQFSKGHVPINKGLTKENYAPLRKVSNLMKKNNPMKNKSVVNKAKKTKQRKGVYKLMSKKMKEGGAIKARMANNSSPNKPEKVIINLIRQNNLNFIYVGNGKKWFKGKSQYFNPDFIDKENKLIIELFGDYWHKNYNKNDQERIETYLEKGYKTLVIWEHELKYPEKVINNIKLYCNSTG